MKKKWIWMISVLLVALVLGVGMSGCDKDEPTVKEDNHRPGIGADDDTGGNNGGSENGGSESGGTEETSRIVGVWVDAGNGSEKLAFDAEGNYDLCVRADDDGDSAGEHDGDSAGGGDGNSVGGEWEVIVKGTYTYNENKHSLDLYPYSDGSYSHIEYRCVIEDVDMILTDVQGKKRKYRRE